MKVVKVIIGLIVLTLIAGWAGYAVWLKPQLEFASVATAFAAKKACSCLHVAKLSFEQCQVDFTDDVSMATFAAHDNIVTVSVLGGRISSQATLMPGGGCQLLPAEVTTAS